MNALVNPWAFFIIIRLAQFVFKIIKLMEDIKKKQLFVNNNSLSHVVTKMDNAVAAMG